MTPVVRIPFPFALIFWTVQGLIWLVVVTFAVVILAVLLLARAGYRLVEHLEAERYRRLAETTEVKR